MAEYSVTYKLGSARLDGVEIDVLVTRDDGEPILGAATRKVFPISTESLADLKDVAALDALVRKEVESWGVPEQDEAARKQLDGAQAALDKAKALDASLATEREVPLVAKAEVVK